MRFRSFSTDVDETMILSEWFSNKFKLLNIVMLLEVLFAILQGKRHLACNDSFENTVNMTYELFITTTSTGFLFI